MYLKTIIFAIITKNHIAIPKIVRGGEIWSSDPSPKATLGVNLEKGGRKIIINKCILCHDGFSCINYCFAQN